MLLCGDGGFAAVEENGVSRENGIRAGKAAGCTTIMIPDVLAPSEEIKKSVDGIYESLDEFTEEVLEK